jgi:hypothetical protein
VSSPQAEFSIVLGGTNTMQTLPKLSHLQTILNFLDKDSDLYESQAQVCALVAQLENNSYTVYSQDFGNTSWKDECVALNVPPEAMEVKLALFVKEVKIDTSDMAKRFCLDNNLIRNYGDGRYYYDHPDNGINDMLIAHIKGDKLVYDISPIFSIGETFSLPYVEYEEDGVTQKTITETYTITGYDLSGCHSNGIVYLGDGGSAWIMEDALIAQKAKFKVGDTFTTQFDYYEKGEIVTHTIASIDFSREEADEVVYWDNNSVYCTESELFRQKEEAKGMNVGQLIAELQKLDPDKLVTIVVGDEDSNIIDTRHFELHAIESSVEYVEFFVHG